MCQACQTPTRSQVDALTWLSNVPVPKELCDANPDIRAYGFYRRLESGRLEFWSICNPEMPPMVSMKGEEYRALLDQYLKRQGSSRLLRVEESSQQPQTQEIEQSMVGGSDPR